MSRARNGSFRCIEALDVLIVDLENSLRRFSEYAGRYGEERLRSSHACIYSMPACSPCHSQDVRSMRRKGGFSRLIGVALSVPV